MPIPKRVPIPKLGEMGLQEFMVQTQWSIDQTANALGYETPRTLYSIQQNKREHARLQRGLWLLHQIVKSKT